LSPLQVEKDASQASQDLAQVEHWDDESYGSTWYVSRHIQQADLLEGNILISGIFGYKPIIILLRTFNGWNCYSLD
jgi:hypothetical protein